MSLKTNFEARIPLKRRVQLSRPEDTGDITQDDVLVQTACDDVEADFRIYAGLIYDDTDDRHVSVAVQGVIFFLQDYVGQSAKKDKWDRWYDRIKALAKVTSRNRPMPTTNSRLRPTPQAPDGQTTTPEFDDSKFGGITPLDPPTGATWPNQRSED